jgi:hypothetical protein
MSKFSHKFEYDSSLTYSYDAAVKNEDAAAHTLLRRIEKLVSQSSDVENDPTYVLWRVKLAIEAYENDTKPLDDHMDYDDEKKDIDDILGLVFREPIHKLDEDNCFDADQAVDRSFRWEFSRWLRRVAIAEQIRTPLHCGLLIRAIENAVMSYLDAIWVVDGRKPDQSYELALATNGDITFDCPELYACLGMEMPTQELQEIA